MYKKAFSVEELLEWAESVTVSDPHYTQRAASAICTVLGVGFPCQVEEPEIVSYVTDYSDAKSVAINIQGEFSAEECRGIAQMLLRKAEEIDK